MKKPKGFTLIELLLAMTLLSMIVMIGTSGFSLFAERWDGRLGRFNETLREGRNLMLIQDALNSILPYAVYNRDGDAMIYFEGNRNGFVAVSSKSVFSHGSFAVIRFSVKQNADFSYDVVYEEWPMEDDVLISVQQPIKFSAPIELFSSVEKPVFNYYGWPEADRRPDANRSETSEPIWTENYDGDRALFAPIKLDFTFQNSEGTYRMIANLADGRQGLLSRYPPRSIDQSDL